MHPRLRRAMSTIGIGVAAAAIAGGVGAAWASETPDGAGAAAAPTTAAAPAVALRTVTADALPDGATPADAAGVTSTDVAGVPVVGDELPTVEIETPSGDLIPAETLPTGPAGN